ncbi:MAG: methylenetetrahydrofolate--tRNA-(uracil(54)-C(5))-methyltransferase (FADH(2)-oxidizing) TrmFO [Paracoccaceae bacterium]|nr:methylenetetrahydrofolate--tRNA-(uracil(54)-C(5))-methyltransferase (FADH(2)-oxidizing) TrmFO [Paracoccaceae bacterium]
MVPINIIGGGIDGCELAWQLVNALIPVILYEMRPKKETFAHKTKHLAELVCSNSFRSNDHENNAVGLLHWEMKEANSLIIKTGYKHSVPAGGALAVDRERFAKEISETLENHPLVKIVREEITDLTRFKDKTVIVATGPLSSKNLIDDLASLTGQENLAFFDAIAPIVYADSVDMSKAWFQSRYDKGETEESRRAYLNCSLNKNEYYHFIDKLLEAEKTEFHDWEKNIPYFNGCLPIETMAERGIETLRFGPMKPIGLTNPHTPDSKPYAVVQLRHENNFGTLFNIVGFQTKMKHSAQIDVFKNIPALSNARFARLGGIHRNTFINSPKVLGENLQLKTKPNIYFAGQITGVEGYVESAAIGLIVGKLIANKTLGKKATPPPPTTAFGALYNHLLDETNSKTFQPMNINFGLFPPLSKTISGRRGRKIRYKAYTDRAKFDFTTWLINC